MPTFIGVKPIWSGAILKRDLLLFDKIAVSGSSIIPIASFLRSRSERADFDWLCEHNLVEEIKLETVLQDSQIDPATINVVFGGLAVIAPLILSEVHEKLDSQWFELLGRGEQAYTQYFPRLIAQYLESKSSGVRAVSLFDEPLEREPVNDSVSMKRFLRHRFWNKYRKQFDADLNVLRENLISGQVTPELILGEWQKASAGLSDQSMATGPVLQVILETLPIPDDSTPWEQVLDFLNDEETHLSRLRLRSWVRKVSAAGQDAREVGEELEFLLAQYSSHMKYHKLRTQRGLLQNVICTTADIAENVVKLNWGDAARALFSVKSGKIALFEAERSAPGHEVAYVLKARDEFGAKIDSDE